MGRPLMLTKDITAGICKHIREGASIEAACQLEGISHQTYFNWVDKAKDAEQIAPEDRTEEERLLVQFFYRTTRALSEREKNLVGVIDKAANEDQKWRAAAWLLERMYPERYSKKVSVAQEMRPAKEIPWADEDGEVSVEDAEVEVVQQAPGSGE